MSGGTVLLIVWAVVMVWSWRAGSRMKEKADAAARRVGWRYGYGQGYVDGQRGRECDHTPPDDGRSWDLGERARLREDRSRPNAREDQP